MARSKGPRFGDTVRQLSEEKKAEIDGGNGEDLTFPRWLRKQPAPVQRQILGPTRHAMWLKGKLPLTAMVSGATGKPLTLDQLRARRRRRVA